MSRPMSAFTSDKVGLRNILDDIHRGRIQLPDFQRNWLWDNEHICSLLASISLSYPIGAILLMRTDGSIDFAPRPINGVISKRLERAHSLILDGQQRLTALYQALFSVNGVSTYTTTGKKTLRFYYLDVEKALDNDIDREEAILSLTERQVSALDSEQKSKYLPFSIIFDTSKLFEWVQKYGSLSSVGHRVFDEIVNYFQYYQLPIIELNPETPKEAVCRVFEKVNTSGVSLTVFELVTAMFAAKSYRLREDWQNRQQVLSGYPVLNALSGSDFLAAITLLSTWEHRQSSRSVRISCSRKAILELTLSDYKQAADRIMQGFEETARFLKRQKIFKAKDIPYHTQLIPLAAVFAALDEKAAHDTVKERIARWFWSGIFGELYGGSSAETRFAKDLPELLDWLAGGKEPSTILDSTFLPTRLIELRTRKSAAYKGISALIMRSGGQDFRTGDTIALQRYFDDKMDIHHIFPRQLCVKLKIERRIYNSIVNKTLLSYKTNRTIGAKPPSIYLATLEKEVKMTPERMDEILRSHLIDPASLRSDDFEAFFKARHKLLLSLIEDATGKPILPFVYNDSRYSFLNP